jgi:hypothetical protein
LIVTFSALVGPLSPNSTLFTLFWMLWAPFALAWLMGKGFGKIDFWSPEPHFPTFFAIRPLPDETWIRVKLQVAARSAFITWLLIAVTIPLWLRLWCDYSPIRKLWEQLAAFYSAPRVGGAVVLLLLCCGLFTWRLLVGSLYIGLFGNRFVLNLSICNVFVTGFAILFSILWSLDNPARWQRWLASPAWLSWLLALTFFTKLIAAALLTRRALRLGTLSLHGMTVYLLAWVVGTGLFSLLLWIIVPLFDGPKPVMLWLALFAMPALRLAAAPNVLTANRHGRSFI